MLLTDRQILRHLQQGSIVISPFEKEQLNNASYDLSVGPFIARYRDRDFIHLAQHGDNPHRPGAFRIEDNRDTGYFVLAPGERILAHSVEFAGGNVAFDEQKKSLVGVNTHLQAKSTAARLGLTVCMCAGWGDVGFINRWTFEIQNMSPCTVQVPVGALVAQLVFHEVHPPARMYHEITAQKYQLSGDIETVKKTWKPEMMIPGSLKTASTWKRTFWGE